MSDMERVVADASVIAKFFVNEVHSEAAHRLRDSLISGNISLSEPSLLFYEVMNAMRYSKARRFTVEELKVIANALENYNFAVFDLDAGLMERTIDVAAKHSISFYDAAYVALAINTDSELYTADEKLIRSAKLPRVIHIRDFV